MSKKEVVRSYRSSLKLSLLALVASCTGLLIMMFSNNQEAIFVFFYQPMLFASAAAVVAFVAIPFLSIVVSFIRGTGRYSIS